jgi:hypothetical protein
MPSFYPTLGWLTGMTCVYCDQWFYIDYTKNSPASTRPYVEDEIIPKIKQDDCYWYDIESNSTMHSVIPRFYNPNVTINKDLSYNLEQLNGEFMESGSDIDPTNRTLADGAISFRSANDSVISFNA